MEQQGRTSVRGHREEREEARAKHEDRQADRCGDGEQAPRVGRADEVEEVVFEEEVVVPQGTQLVVEAFVVEEVVLAQALVEEALMGQRASDLTYIASAAISSGLKNTARTTLRSTVERMLLCTPVMTMTRGRW